MRNSLLLLVLFIGCNNGPDPVKIELVTALPAEFGNRFQVKVVAEFSDSYAYNQRRRVYILTDTLTGKEYVGMSGVGMSEIGIHDDGDGGTKHEQ